MQVSGATTQRVVVARIESKRRLPHEAAPTERAVLEYRDLTRRIATNGEVVGEGSGIPGVSPARDVRHRFIHQVTMKRQRGGEVRHAASSERASRGVGAHRGPRFSNALSIM
jgi:hypothetical protein